MSNADPEPVYASDTSGGGAPKELPPPGLHNAVCAFVEDLGEAVNSFTNKLQRKLVICWELEEKMTDGRPFMLSKTYTNSLFEKANLCQDLESWRGRPFTEQEKQKFNVSSLVGVGCTLNVMHRAKKGGGGMTARISSISPTMKGAGKLQIYNVDPPKWIERQREDNRQAVIGFHTGGTPVTGEEAEGFDSVPF